MIFHPRRSLGIAESPSFEWVTSERPADSYVWMGDGTRCLVTLDRREVTRLRDWLSECLTKL